VGWVEYVAWMGYNIITYRSGKLQSICKVVQSRIPVCREVILRDSWSSASHKMIHSISSCCLYPWQLPLHPLYVCTLSLPRTKVCSVGWDFVKPWAQTGPTCPSWWRWYRTCQVLRKAVVSLALPLQWSSVSELTISGISSDERMSLQHTGAYLVTWEPNRASRKSNLI